MRSSVRKVRNVVLLLAVVCMLLASTEVYAVDKSSDEQSAAGKSRLANSWRFKDGEPIDPADIDSRDSGNGGAIKRRSSAQMPDITRKGIDVSEWQWDIDWEKVKESGIEFAIIRCGYGENQTDQDDAKFLRNVTECERLDIPYGVYIYSYATDTASAADEADHVLRLIKGHDLSYPVYFDMEDKSTLPYRANFGAIASAFCSKISAAGYPVGVYANLNWWNNYLTSPVFDNWYKWVAQYYTTCQYQKEYAMWQYSSSGSVSGINGHVDMNYLIGYPDDHGRNNNAAIDEGTYTISSKADPERVISIKDASVNNNESAQLDVPSGDAASSQKFEVISVGEKRYKLLAEHSGKALDVRNSNKEPGAEMQQYEWHQARAQIWEFTDAGDGYYYIKSKLGTYLKQDAAGSSVLTTSEFFDDDTLKWKLELTVLANIDDGIYNIVSAADNDAVLEVKDGGVADRVAVQTGKYSNQISQQYSVKYVNNGYYRITAEHSGKVFDVASGSKDAGASLQQYRDNGSNAQLWKFVETGDGHYYLKSKLGTTVTLSDAYSSDRNGAVSMEVMAFGDGQKWELKPAELTVIEDGVYSLRNKSNTSNAVIENNGNVELAGYENFIEQKYRIEKQKNGYCRIVDMSSGKVLSAVNGSGSPGTRLKTSDWNGSDVQLWRIAEDVNGGYLLKSKTGAFAVPGSVKAGSVISLGSFNGKAEHKWVFKTEKLIYSDKSANDASENIGRVFGSNASVRYAGADRYDTAIMAADALKKGMDVKQFKNIIIACGSDYPDALSGSCLAAEKNAPILLIDDSCKEKIERYVEKNLKNGGTVYLLGGEGVISRDIEKSLKAHAAVKRLAGKDRYGTNLAVLKEADVTGETLLVCSGQSFADSLSVSSTGLPILLAADTMTTAQKSYISDIDPDRFYMIGGTGAVSSSVERTCKLQGDTVRLAGKNRYTTSTAVARAFYGDWSSSAVLAYAQNFPDGLAGGTLAMSLQAPVLLTDNVSFGYAGFYGTDAGLEKAAVLGGVTLINDDVVNKVIN